MGLYSAIAKDLMLDALRGTNPTTPITHVGAYDADPAITAASAAASTDNVTKTAHGLSNGDLIVFTSLTGGTGLVAQRPYFVIGSTANTFQVAVKPGGAAVDISVDYTDATIRRLIEISGGTPAYARKVIAFNAAANGTMDDSTNGAVLDIPAEVTVDWIGLFSALAGGSLLVVDDVTAEAFASQGTYTVTDADLDLLAA